MDQMPEVTTQETIERRSGYQALERPERPSWWGVDLDPARRPGVPSHATPPRPLANARWPVERQQGVPASPLHGRPNKRMPPVFGTAVPPKGLSGAIRNFAARWPDHKPTYWLLKLFSDRVDSFEYHSRKYLPLALPLVALAVVIRLTRD